MCLETMAATCLPPLTGREPPSTKSFWMSMTRSAFLISRFFSLDCGYGLHDPSGRVAEFRPFGASGSRSSAREKPFGVRRVHRRGGRVRGRAFIFAVDVGVAERQT